MKSTSYVDSSDQIQIRICEFHSLFVFWERIWTKNFDKRYGTQQMRYMYNILPEPMLVAPRL